LEQPEDRNGDHEKRDQCLNRGDGKKESRQGLQLAHFELQAEKEPDPGQGEEQGRLQLVQSGPVENVEPQWTEGQTDENVTGAADQQVVQAEGQTPPAADDARAQNGRHGDDDDGQQKPDTHRNSHLINGIELLLLL